MGMFDYIKCEMPLPNIPPPPSSVWFQTKDTPTIQLWMDKWVIKPDGQLVKLGYRIEDRSDKSAPKGSLDSLRGLMTKEYDARLDETIEFHGDIGFYERDDETGEVWEYAARFTDGICSDIRLVDHLPAAPPLDRSM